MNIRVAGNQWASFLNIKDDSYFLELYFVGCNVRAIKILINERSISPLRTKKHMRKTNRSTRNKGVQKHTSLNRDGVEMRNRLQRMMRYLKEKIDSLNKLSRRDLRIRTPLDRRPSNVWHNIIKGWRLCIRIDGLLNYRNTKSLSHYPRGNGELYTSYPTPKQGVGRRGSGRTL